MAFGMTYASPIVAACISNAFDSDPGVIFVAAAGSVVSRVVFPANVDREVLAVSMVEISDTGGDYRMFSVPFTASYGPEVDFVSVMASNGIPASGIVGNVSQDDIPAFKWSSAATGVYSGLIALALPEGWPTNINRAQFISRLRFASSLADIHDVSGEPARAVIGAGILNAYLARGGSTSLSIAGQYEVEAGKTFNLVAEGNGFGPLNYAWGPPVAGATTQSIMVVAPNTPGEIMNFSVSAADPIDGRSLFAPHPARVVSTSSPPIVRTLFSADYVLDFPVFFNGGRFGRILNPQVLMPPGCSVLDVLGVPVCRDASGHIFQCSPEVTGGSAFSNWDGTPLVNYTSDVHGFTISRLPGLSPRSLEVNIHQWHDGLSEIRTKAVYRVSQPAGLNCSVPGATADNL